VVLLNELWILHLQSSFIDSFLDELPEPHDICKEYLLRFSPVNIIKSIKEHSLRLHYELDLLLHYMA